MRRPLLNKVVAILAPTVAMIFVAHESAARLSVIPGGPRVTATPAATATPQPSATTTGQGSVAGCRTAIAAESGPLLDGVRRALSTCLARGVDCLVNEAGSSACCAEGALLCQSDLITIAAATRHFRESVRDGSCAQVALDALVAEDGLGFDAAACARLVPPISVTDHASFADCLQLLLTKDVLHQVGLTDLPRAPEALVCMGLDDALSDALGADPPTCEPSPSPVPTATPIAATPGPTPGPTATSGDTGPTPHPTPSPGPSGCQPALFGPCNSSGFTTCCTQTLACIGVVSPSDGSGICINATPTPAATSTPGPSATSTGGSATPAPTATPPGATPTVGPTSSAGATPSPGPTATQGAGCTSLIATVSVNYDQSQFPDVAGVTIDLGYPASVSIPGFGSDASVAQRVTNLTGVSGIFSVGDQDTAINVGLVSLSAVIPPGQFVRIVFDCASGAAAPGADAFSCSPDATTLLGGSVSATCAVAVATS